MSVSVCTLAFGRDEHLVNLVRGLARSRIVPGELVVVVLQDALYNLPETGFPVRQVKLSEPGLSLAEARNRAAAEAQGDLLVFLDVDCIPDPDCIGDYVQGSAAHAGVLMGEVAYLPRGATRDGLDFARFAATGVTHSERAGAPEGDSAPCSDYRCFWSLNFAIRAADFAATGGFDEAYRGYGGEDTDFGRVVATKGMPIWWLRGAKAYHQYHPHHMPPVHHLDSVLANARTFQAKWGESTMQHWLRAFTLMGLVEPQGDGWRKLRDPSEADLALTRQQAHQPYASSAWVLERLEMEAAAAA